MSDVQRAFMLLDIIQGHPGYAVNCYACGRPMTDIFGEVLEAPPYGPVVQIQGSSEGLRHHVDAYNWCPYALFGETA